MSVLDKVKGDDLLDTTVTVKINADHKEELVEFCKEHKISMGKLVRYGLDMVVSAIKKEQGN